MLGSLQRRPFSIKLPIKERLKYVVMILAVGAEPMTPNGSSLILNG